MSKSAFITGISGQDGSYLAELLLEQGYTVSGMVRRNSTSENQSNRIEHIRSDIALHYGDLTDMASISRAISVSKPDEIYNLGAMSHVAVSFVTPQYTAAATGVGVLNLIETARVICPNAKIYQASSSEMFGNQVDPDKKQRETTPMKPVSPYGSAKLFAYNIIQNYRNSYGTFAANGILFNHESPRRATNFVSQKIVQGAVAIKQGLKSELVLGNLDAARDWGHAKDYVKAMYLILQQDKPDDFVISTGHTRTVRELAEITFKYLNLNYLDYVKTDDKFLRPQELNYLCGDSSKARKILGWAPQITFNDMVAEMVEAEMNRCSI